MSKYWCIQQFNKMVHTRIEIFRIYDELFIVHI